MLFGLVPQHVGGAPNRMRKLGPPLLRMLLPGELQHAPNDFRASLYLGLDRRQELVEDLVAVGAPLRLEHHLRAGVDGL